MILKGIVPLIMGTALLGGTVAMADEYRPGDFLTLDLPRAVLSPKSLGPEAHFEPVPLQARTDRAVAAVQPAAKPDVPHAVATARVHAVRSAVKPIAAPRGAARTRLAHRHGNPLDAQAMDARIQSWPCKPGSGGICAWKQ